jgi:hypothetical protein
MIHIFTMKLSIRGLENGGALIRVFAQILRNFYLLSILIRTDKQFIYFFSLKLRRNVNENKKSNA